MDYRKPKVFGENWSPSRYTVLPYLAVERELFTAEQRILDLGCASGWNMSRFLQYGCPPAHLYGLDVVPERVQLATQFGHVLLGSGLSLPFPNESFDVIYIQHVLHHIGDVDQALAEVRRCLRPNGLLFLVETTEDSPLIRWGRRLYPKWMGDEINAPFRFAELQAQLAAHGLAVQRAEQYSVLFWVWEIVPDQFPRWEAMTPFWAWLERGMVRLWSRYSAHCFMTAVRDGEK